MKVTAPSVHLNRAIFFLKLDMHGVGARQGAIAGSQPICFNRILRRFLKAGLHSEAEVVAGAKVEVAF